MFTSVHNVERINDGDFGRLSTRLTLAEGVEHWQYHTGGLVSIVWRAERFYHAFVDSLLQFSSHRQCVNCSNILRTPEDDNYFLCLACRFRMEQVNTHAIPIVPSGKEPIVNREQRILDDVFLEKLPAAHDGSTDFTADEAPEEVGAMRDDLTQHFIGGRVTLGAGMGHNQYENDFTGN